LCAFRCKLKWEAEAIADHNAKASDVIHLNIGGEHKVSATRKTLTQFDNSMLAAMFSGRHHLATDDDGRVLLERDPNVFSYVLDYLQNGGKLPPNLPTDEHELERVREEFDYFLLDEAFREPSLTLTQVSFSLLILWQWCDDFAREAAVFSFP
jgi:hypothetical protein